MCVFSNKPVWLSALVLVTAAVFTPDRGTAQTKSSNSEALPGGAATSKSNTVGRNAFSQASGNLSFAKEFDFKIGNAVFRKLWVSAPSSTKSSDGLGPLFNARSCQRCHLKDGRGHPPIANWPADNAISMLLKLSIPAQSPAERQAISQGRIPAIPEPTYGFQLQDTAIQGHKSEGRIHITYKERELKLAGGEVVNLRTPHYRITHLGYGPLHPHVLLSPRVAPSMIGLGLLEAVSDSDILKATDPDDRDANGISGRANRAWSTARNRMQLGRFGWKATAPDIPTQTAAAFAHDMGLSTARQPKPYGDCTKSQTACRKAPHGAPTGNPEVPPQLMRLVVFYSRNLAVPPRRNLDKPDVQEGKTIFNSIGCASCHTPSFKTASSKISPHLGGQRIWPYTDLLLHDMGPGLSDRRPEGLASGTEWRTPPLWGIGLTKVVSGHTFLLHDGRARNVKEAILWHGGEAQKSRDKFIRLDRQDRERLIAFVNSL